MFSCVKDDGDNGTYIGSDGNTHNIEYISGYVSSDKKFALASGRVTARIKTTFETSARMFPCAFWTFGQDNIWANCVEFDVMEMMVFTTDEQRTAKDGTVIPSGSVANYSAASIHYRNSDDENALYRRTLDTNYALGGADGTQKNFYLYNNIDFTKWHEYTVQWDEYEVMFLIDGDVFIDVKAKDLSMSENGFYYPQDIRFNIKASEYSDEDTGAFLVDWVKVETKDVTPALSISHSDISLSVGETAYIRPTFNTGCNNMAYEMETNNSHVTVQRYNNEVGQCAYNMVTGTSAGTSVITMTTPGGITGTFTVTVS